jgi:hypothetical protein
MAEEKYNVNVVNTENISSYVYKTSQIFANASTVEEELTSLIKSLLSVGVYDSIESAQTNNVPAGTFVIIDDPETEEKDFQVKVVPDYTSEEELRILKERLKAEELLKAKEVVE